MVFPPTHLIDLNELAPGEEEEEIGEKAEEPVELQLGRRRPDIEEEEEEGKTRLRFVPLCDVYSATSPYVSSIGGSSKKVKPPNLPNLHHHRQPVIGFDCCDSSAKTGDRFLSSSAAVMDSGDRVSVRSDSDDGSVKMAITNVYVRRNKVGGRVSYKKPRFEREKKGVLGLDLEDWKGNVSEESRTEEEEDGELVGSSRKRKRPGGSEPEDSGLNSPGYSNSASLQFRGPRKSNVLNRDSRDNKNVVTDLEDIESGKKKKRKHQGDSEDGLKNVGPFRMKKWTWLKIDGADPNKFVGLRCKVFWPLDADWYSGQVFAYDSKTGRHHIKYKDGEEENVIISNEEIKFHISPEEMQTLKLSTKSFNVDGIDVNELVALAASLDDCDELEPANIIWAKLTGHAMWPALILDDSIVGEHKGLNKNMGDKSVLVQFFGTHDFARIKRNQVMSFLKGLISSFHLKCRKEIFARSLDEARMYLSEQKLPKRMSRLRNGLQAGDCNGESGEDEGSAGLENDAINTEEIQRRIEALKSFPFEIGDLQLISLGTVVKDSDNFQDERSIWPDGYTALRKFPSIADPNLLATYRMEVSRDNCLRTRPHFKVTSENGEQFSGSTPAACWSKIYRKMRKIEPEGLKAVVPEKIFESGAEMFGFTHPEISKLIKELATSTSRHPSKGCKMSRARCQDVPVGYRPVDVKWKDLDKCHVCHMDEEYENNLFLQCDKCRIMVHARCYGELEAADGALWLCNLCRPGAPEQPPRCCLCPVTGGAMKPTTDGRWAHLACAIWIPETCLSDIKKMEPIDGLSRVNKDRWKLLCRICGVSYGACIQCSNHSCRVAYHPLCARAAGFCVELEEEDRQYLIAPDEDEDDLCIRLLSFCKRHRPVSKDRCTAEDRTSQKLNFLDYSPPINPSGCARTEPYNYFGRRGRKEPEALAAASLKQLYVENRPHIVGGFCRHESLYDSSITLPGSKFSVDSLNLKLKTCQQDASGGILSVAEKHRYMKETVKKRLAFGKSGIHGFGIFAKHSHRAGDMMIEYVGELVRPSIADRREHMIYNSMVGAGTYMFRVDDRRVIDATRAGSIAHLINHSCDPNCYSRMITVNGDEHIIIFSKRDIKQWEELTYDYRFYAIDEQLACYCGVPGCRGVVNDPEAKEPAGKLYAPCSELIDWKGE